MSQSSERQIISVPDRAPGAPCSLISSFKGVTATLTIRVPSNPPYSHSAKQSIIMGMEMEISVVLIAADLLVHDRRVSLISLIFISLSGLIPR